MEEDQRWFGRFGCVRHVDAHGNAAAWAWTQYLGVDDLRDWLRENLHRHGRKYTSREMLERITGGPIDPGPYLRYLREKLGDIYGLPVEAGAAV